MAFYIVYDRNGDFELMPRPAPQQTMVKVDGDKELIRQFRALSQGLGQAALVKAVEKGAEVIVVEAQARAPVRSGGGQLRDSIHAEELISEPKRASVGVSWRVKKGVSGKGKASRHPVFYGIMVERGTKTRQRKTWRKTPLTTGPVSTGTVRAQPFLEPAYDAKKQQASERIKKALAQMIEKVARRG